MKILAIDLSSSCGSVAVAVGGRVVGERRFACERGRGVGVFAALKDLRPAWCGAEIIAVGIGPGSYNGLRAACAMANSMQLATGARLCASPSVCLLPVDDGHYFVVGDARGGRAYRAEVRDRRLRGEISLISHSEAAALSSGKSAPTYRVGPLPGGDDLPESTPEAGVLALLAPELAALSPQKLQPIYLKPPHITMPRGNRT